MKKPTPKSEPKNKPTLVAFLLDRSGSMKACQDETISGFNAYVDQLEKDQTDGARFTLTQFDTQGIDIVHNAVPLKKVARLDQKTYVPRGGTPLYDALGRTINATMKQAGTKFKVLFVTLTDGEENSSREFDLEQIQKLIKEMEDKYAWTFAHIGVGAEGWAATRKYAFGTQSVTNVLHIDRENVHATMRQAGGQSVSYMASMTNCAAPDTAFWSGPEPKKPEPKAKK